MQPTIDDRLLLILKQEGGRPNGPSIFDREKGAQLAYKGFLPRLGELTGIKVSRWRSFFIGQQGARSDMIQASARLWPQYAFWLVTGVTDATNGHVAPVTAVTFPERLYAEDSKSMAYFKQSIELLGALLEGVDSPASIERSDVLGKWMGGAVVDEAYALATTDEYRQVKELWLSREDDRKGQLGRITGTHRPWLDRRKGDKAVETPKTSRDPRIAHQDDWDLFYVIKAGDE